MDKIKTFAEKFVLAGGEIVDALTDLSHFLKDIKNFAAEDELKNIVVSNFAFLTEVEPEKAEVSFTKAICGISETGSVIFAYTNESTHLLISLPKIHVVFLNKNSIYWTLEEALMKLIDKPYISIITGPSKTGDIDLIHVMGVHGPEKLILCWEE